MRFTKKGHIIAILLVISILGCSMGVHAVSIEEDIDRFEARNAEIDTQKKSADQQCVELSDQILELNNIIEGYQSGIDVKNEEIDVLEEKYSAAKKNQEKHYESIEKNFSSNGSVGSLKFFSVLFNSDSSVVKAIRSEYLKKYSAEDREIIEAYLDLCNEIRNEENEIKAAREELEELKAPYDEAKSKLEALFDEKAELIERLEVELGSNNEHLVVLMQQLEEYNRRQAEADIVSKTAAGLTDEGKGMLINPCPAGRLTYGVGYREDGYHKGIDLVCGTGNDIYAALGGVVTTAGYSNSAGNWIVIDHQNGMISKYMHCSALYVSAGETVVQGQCIAAVGNTGNSEGSHLHFQVEVNGSVTDPYLFIE